MIHPVSLYPHPPFYVRKLFLSTSFSLVNQIAIKVAFLSIALGQFDWFVGEIIRWGGKEPS